MMTTAKRAWPLVLAWLAFLCYVAVAVNNHVKDQQAVARGARPFYTDFLPFYSAALQIRREPAENLFDLRRRYVAMVAAIETAYGPGLTKKQSHSAGIVRWMHPPTLMLILAPLGALPFVPAFILWLAATAIPYLAAMRAIIPGRAAAFAFALGCPPVFFNIVFGQTAFLTGGFIGLGLALLHARPVLAGISIGLASVNPHFGILLPPALLLGGHFRAFWAAAASLLGLAGISLAAFGMAPWERFFAALIGEFSAFDPALYNPFAAANMLALLQLAGLPPVSAWTGQLVTTAAALAAVLWAWRSRRPEELGLQSAILCCAAILVLPMVYLYDLVLLVPAAAWLWLDLRAGWQRAALLACLAALLPVRELAMLTGFQAAPLLVAALLGMAVSRLAALRRAAAAANVPGNADGGERP